jgi:hypothetical protein
MATPSEGHHDRPGEFPTVVDEAANSPRWIPIAGAALVLVALLFAAYRAGGVNEEEEIAPEGEAAAIEGDAPKDEEVPPPAPAPVAPAVPVPTPAAAPPPG